jgi:hypothetical protein
MESVQNDVKFITRMNLISSRNTGFSMIDMQQKR